MKFSVSIILLLFLLSSSLWSQKSNFYYGPNTRLVENEALAISYKLVNRRSDKRYTIKSFSKANAKWVMVSSERIRIKGGSQQYIRYHTDNFLPRRIIRTMDQSDFNTYAFEEREKNKLLRTGFSTTFLPLQLEGEIREYYANGALKSIAQYADNQLISNRNWLEDGSSYIDSVFYSVDRQPLYSYGDEFMRKYLIAKIQEAKIDISQIQDELLIGWVVMETGKMDGVIALKGKSKQLNDFFVEVISQLPGEWKPASLNGSAVRCFVTFPINFRQNNARFQEIELSGGMLHYNSY